MFVKTRGKTEETNVDYNFRFLQVDTITLLVFGQATTQSPQFLTVSCCWRQIMTLPGCFECFACIEIIFVKWFAIIQHREAMSCLLLAKISWEIRISWTGHLVLTIYSITFKRISQPFTLDGQSYIDQASHAAYTSTEMYTNKMQGDSSLHWWHLQTTDYHFCENSSISKYYAILIPFMEK